MYTAFKPRGNRLYTGCLNISMQVLILREYTTTVEPRRVCTRRVLCVRVVTSDKSVSINQSAIILIPQPLTRTILREINE